jgi:Protein of unknown function (DUF3237)
MLDLTPAFTAHVDVGEVLDLGISAGAHRRVVPILGGSVSGPRLTAEILPGGADWQVVRPNGTLEVVARYTLRATDGTLISVINKGLRRGPADVLARLAAGQDVDASEYYFRTAPVFQVAAGPHEWMAETLFVATGERRARQVVIRVYAVD